MQKKIMVIEDDQDTLDIITIILQEAGYKVTASTRATIVNDIPAIQPDLILLDNWLSDGDGAEISKNLKSNHATKGIPIILVSAVNSLELIVEEAYADDFVRKPFDIDHLLEVVASNLKRASQTN